MKRCNPCGRQLLADGAEGSCVWGRGLLVVSGIWSEEDVDDDQDGVGIDEECQDGDKDYRLAAQVGRDENHQYQEGDDSRQDACGEVGPE